MFNLLKRNRQADRILQVCARITEEIIAAYQKKNNAKEPLYVVLGENHKNAAQILSYILILQNLRQRGYRTVFGLENNCRTLQNIFKDYAAEKNFNGPLPQLEDPKGFLSLVAAVGYLYWKEAELSSNILYNHLFYERQSIGFNDEYSQSSANSNAENKLPRGVKFRNDAIVENVLHQARILNPIDIYIQSCGNAHVFGHHSGVLKIMGINIGLYNYEESLTAIFTRADVPLLSISRLGIEDLHVLPPDALKAENCKNIIFEGPEFWSAQHGDRARECAWLNDIMPSLPISPIVKKRKSEICRRYMEDYFDTILHHACG